MRDATSVRRSWICTAIPPPLPPPSFPGNSTSSHVHLALCTHGIASTNISRGRPRKIGLPGLVASWGWSRVSDEIQCWESICVRDIIAARFRIESVRKYWKEFCRLNMMNAYRRSGYKRSILAERRIGLFG